VRDYYGRLADQTGDPNAKAAISEAMTMAEQQLARFERGVVALERIADALEANLKGEGRARALEEWRHGTGRHPDD
jgi:hypothetical protein